MTKYERIKKLCKEQGKSISQMERDLGFAKGSISKIDDHMPSVDRVSKICMYLNASPLTLFLDESSDLEDRNQAMEYTNAINESPVDEIVYDVDAGNGRINDVASQSAEDSLIVRICGESMYPTLHDGDMVRVIPSTKTVESELTIVKINGDEATCKHVEITDTGIWLRGENADAYTDRFYSVQEVLTLPVQVVGKAVEIVSRKL